MILINKFFSCKITLTDQNAITNQNLTDLIFNTLKENFEGRNYNSSFIKKINRIIKRSHIDASSNSLSVEFEADVYKIEKFDIILNNNIQDINENRVLCISKNYMCMVRNVKQMYSKYEKNQNIPLFVNKINYSLMHEDFSINAVPFVPFLKNKNDIYYKIGSLSTEDKNYIQEKILVKIQKEYEYINKYKDDARYKYFVKLLYIFKDDKLKTKFKKHTTNLLDLNAEGIVSRLNIFDIYDHSLIVINDSTIKQYEKQAHYLGDYSNPITTLSALEVYMKFLNEYYGHIYTIRKLHTIYDDEMFKSHAHVFSDYEAGKI